MKKIILIYFLFFVPFKFSHAQNAFIPNNLGVAVDVLGPIFGEYSLGLNTFVGPNIQLGVNSTYFSTQYISPEIKGWQSAFRMNYFFSTWRRSGFYLGGASGFESVRVKNDSNSHWEDYNDITWAIIPGYALVVGRPFIMMFGLSYGYNLGSTQFLPEASFIFLL
ncbi:MAG: hypothetical protein V4591_04235 [Bdellovibrionota bacterium]